MSIKFHPSFKNDQAIWKQIDDFLNLDPVSLSARYLFKYESEKVSIGKTSEGNEIWLDPGTKNWNRRVECAEYVNHCQQLLHIHKSALAREMQIIGANSSEWEELLLDLTGEDHTKQEFLQEVVSLYLTHGRVGLLVDAPASVSETLGEAKQNQERAFISIYSAHNIIDWQTFRSGSMRGKFQNLLLRQGEDSFLRLFVEQPGQPYKWEILQGKNKGAQVIEQGSAGVSEIPFVMIGDGAKESILKDIVSLSKARLRRASSLESIHHNQSSQRIHISGISPGDIGNIRVMSESNISWSPDPASTISTIPPADPTSLESSIKTLDRMIIKVGMLQRHSLSDDSLESPSADSKNRDMQTLVDHWTSALDKIERKLARAFNYLSEMQGLEDVVKVKIKRDFLYIDTERDLLERQLVASQARALGNEPIQKEILKIGVNNLRLVPPENESEDDLRKRLLDSVDNSSAAVSTFTSVTAPRVSLLDETESEE